MITPFERIEKLHKYLKIWRLTVNFWYGFSAVKAMIKLLFSTDYFRNYHFYDCFIIGRFKFYGRTAEISDYMMIAFLVHFIIYKIILHSKELALNFDYLEFLLYDEEDIRMIEVTSKLNENLPLKFDDAISVSAYLRLKNADRNRPHQAIFTRDTFNSIGEGNSYLKPNRNYQSWNTLALCTQVSFYLAIILYIFWFYLVDFLVVPRLNTNVGFELSYPKCVRWLVKSLNEVNGNLDEYRYGQIYVPSLSGLHLRWLNRTVAREEFNIDMLPFNLPPIKEDTQSLTQTWYNFFRISTDFIENYVWYYDFLGYFTGTMFTLTMCSIDIILNAKGIIGEMETTLRELASRRANSKQTLINKAGQPCQATMRRQIQKRIPDQSNSGNRLKVESGYQTQRRLQSSPYSNQYFDRIFNHKMQRVQIILVDHFNLISDYNKYVSTFITLLFSMLFFFSLVICTWITRVQSKKVESEFLVTQIGGVLFVGSLVCGAAFSRKYNLKIYQMIASAMALDNLSARSKLRWHTILKYYYPKPLYCFCLFSTIEVSWYLVIQVSMIRVKLIPTTI